MAHTYCLDEQEWKKSISPIQSTTVIGSPANCNQNRNTMYNTPPKNPTYPEQPPSYYQQQFPFLHIGAINKNDTCFSQIYNT